MCHGFLSLKKNWLCFAKSLYVSLALATVEECTHIFILGDELLSAHASFVSQDANFLLARRRPARRDTIPYITGAGHCDEEQPESTYGRCREFLFDGRVTSGPASLKSRREGGALHWLDSLS